jgi:5-methylcytosine-specific restriction endonuclease McrA
MSRLTKAQREQVRQMFNGRCAYCGEALSDRWHADHVESVNRKMIIVPGRGFVPTGELWRPENDHIGNLMPACPPCNIDKHAMSLENWRQKLSRSVEVLTKNYPTFRHARRFGLVQETGATVTFYFERIAKAAT